MSKKKLLKEETVRRFWKLANISPLKEFNTIVEDDEENLEENQDEENLEENQEEIEELKAKRDDDTLSEQDDLGSPVDGLDAAGPEGDLGPAPEDDAPPAGDVEAEVSVPEEDVQSLEAAVRVLQDILDAAGGAGEEEPAPEEAGLPPAEEEAPAAEEEELMEVGIDDTRLSEVIETITNRVTKRIMREALVSKIKK